MTATARLALAIALLGMCGGCFAPSDTTPGLHLSGEVATPPGDWSFTDDHELIAIEIHTPYLLPHSVTIWCASIDGELFVGARDPETKRWPGWADADPEVRLKIGEQIYEVRLAPIDDAERVAEVRRAYAEKYDLPSSGADRPIRYWTVEARS